MGETEKIAWVEHGGRVYVDYRDLISILRKHGFETVARWLDTAKFPNSNVT